jgi:hypothetical protein
MSLARWMVSQNCEPGRIQIFVDVVTLKAPTSKMTSGSTGLLHLSRSLGEGLLDDGMDRYLRIGRVGRVGDLTSGALAQGVNAQ